MSDNTPEIIERIRKLNRSDNEYETRTFEEFTQIGKNICSGLNGGGESVARAGLVNGIVGEHRHLQGVSIVTLFQVLGEIGSLPEGTYTDARNQFAYDLCRKLRERFREELYWKDPVV